MSILELENVTKTFDGVRAVNKLSLSFGNGKINVLIGPNGAGKTTIFNLISGLLTPDEGTIRYNGTNIASLAAWQIAEMGIGRLFQDVRLFDRLTVRDNVLVAFKKQIGESVLMSVLARWKVKAEESRLRERTNQLLDFVGLTDRTEDLAENLSYGQQKLLSIARLLAADAKVLLLDEPTAGVSPQRVNDILDIIQRLRDEGNTTVVIEHNMNIVAEIADWIYFIDEGQLTSDGKLKEVLANPDVRRAYVGF